MYTHDARQTLHRDDDNDDDDDDDEADKGTDGLARPPNLNSHVYRHSN